MLDLAEIDVEEIATALADQTDYEHRWLLDPRTSQVVFWTRDTGIDGENPVEIDELDLIPIDPIPSNVWYQDPMAQQGSLLRARSGSAAKPCRYTS